MNSIRIVAVYNYQIKNNIYQKYPNVTPCLHDTVQDPFDCFS